MKESEVYKCISSDDIDSREAFIKDFDNELLQLSKLFSEAFILLNASPCISDLSERAGIVSAYLSLAIESAVTATQLLVLGHIAAAGNSMRISYESLCYSALLKKEVELEVPNGKYKFNFYSDYQKKSKHTRADSVIDVVVKNKELIGVNEEGVTFLTAAKNFYNGYSHATLLLAHSKIKPSTRQIYIAGGYDNERYETFKTQLNFITRYSLSLSGWVSAVAYNA